MNNKEDNNMPEPTLHEKARADWERAKNEARSGTPTSRSGVDGPHSFHWSHDSRDQERIEQMRGDRDC